MQKLVALIMVFSLSFFAGAEENTPLSKNAHDDDELKHIDYMLDNLEMSVLPVESEDEADSEDVEDATAISDDEEPEDTPPHSDSSKEVPVPPSQSDDSSEMSVLPVESEDEADSEDVEDAAAISDDEEPEETPPHSDSADSSKEVLIPPSQSDDSSEKFLSMDNAPKAAPEPEGKSQVTPKEFRIMCASSEPPIVLDAIEKRNADVNAADAYGVTPLMFAAKSNPSAEIIDFLVSAGAKIDAKDSGGKTALMYAAESNPNPDITYALAENGALVNARDKNRKTALMYAARTNNAEVVQALIDAGAEELADSRGWTPLFWAARYSKHPEVITILLDAGHNPKARSYDMATPIEHANINPNLLNTEELLRLEKESR